MNGILFGGDDDDHIKFKAIRMRVFAPAGNFKFKMLRRRVFVLLTFFMRKFKLIKKAKLSDSLKGNLHENRFTF